ncbi:MAG: hypothetical protein HQK89_12400 [Nitrospirae bacterium]|nr:hypothetical protein [Nitrospirota bacterium]
METVTIYDQDYGLELKPQVEQKLIESFKEAKQGKGIPLKEVKRQLGL